MKIIFEKITFKNVLGYGNKLSEFSFVNGIDLIVGMNGNGKSTVVDAITYCLFGKPFRKIKIDKLINNKNNKELFTELLFSVDGQRYKVQRGKKPDIFMIFRYIEGSGFSLIEKPSTNREYQLILEKNLLHFGENVFRQLIALGANLTSSKNFMDLTKSEKEEILQVITDTLIFKKIKDKLKEEQLSKKTKITELKYRIEVQNQSFITISNNIKKMEEQNYLFLKNKKNILEELEASSKIKEQDILSSKENIKKLPKLLEDKEKLEKRKIFQEDKSSKLSQSENELKIKASKLLISEKDKITCPKCSFEIKETFSYTNDEVKSKFLMVVSEKKEISKNISSLKKEIDSVKEEIDILKTEFRRIKIMENELKSLKSQIEKTNNWKEVEINYKELEELEETFTKSKNSLIKLKSELTDLNDLEDMVSDRNLKGIIINQQLPYLNKYINEFLELFGSKYNFVINSSFEEIIIHRNNESDFNGLSNGQKQRISLSILFAFLKLIEERNGISTNLLILDEYLDSSLDVNGIEEVMYILESVFSPQKDILLISHNSEIKGKLELLNRVMKVETKNGFCEISEEKI